MIDPSIGERKSLVVTGKLTLYGNTANSVNTKLTSIANAGDSTIQVLSTVGWSAGQTLGIAPSFKNPD